MIIFFHRSTVRREYRIFMDEGYNGEYWNLKCIVVVSLCGKTLEFRSGVG